MSEIPDGTGEVSVPLVRFARDLVERSGAAGRIEEELAVSTGRPRKLSTEALLVALLLLGLEDRPLHLTLVTELLWRRLAEADRQALFVEGEAQDRQAFLARYRQVRYLFARICRALDPEGQPKNRCLNTEEARTRAQSIPKAESDRRRTAIDGFVADLVAASVGVQNEKEQGAHDGSIGLDATCVPLYSRGPSRRRGRGAADPDGGWYVREGDHRGAEDRRGRVLGKVAWALEATIAVTSTPPGSPAAHPSLIVGLTLGRPGVDPGGTGAKVLAAVAARGLSGGFVGADRAYSAARADRFHLPVRALGYTPVFDYRSDELGVQANSGGALLVEGRGAVRRCPHSSSKRPRITALGRSTTRSMRTGSRRAREWWLSKKAGPDDDGYERFGCPAAGSSPRLACPLRPSSSTVRDGRTKVLDPPPTPPRCCTQGTITIAPDVSARHRQPIPFGTEAWRRRYATCRNTIEGTNGYLKDGAHEALADPSRRRVRGLVAQSIFCALLVMAANVRKLRAFREMQDTEQTEAVNGRARRRRTSIEDFRPNA